MRGYTSVGTSGWIVLAACALGSAAEPQEFVPPAQSFSFEDDGTLEQYQQGYLQIRDSKMDQWLLQIAPETKITVNGEAERDYLRPGLNIEFAGEFDKKGALSGAIEAIEIITAKGKPAFGLFAADDSADGKPVRNAGAGSYRIRGKLAGYKAGALTVAIGSRRITGNLADNAAITFTSEDPSVADMGDKVKVKAWYYANKKPVAAINRAGAALAEEITITLAKPLAPTGRRARQAERPLKAIAKEKAEK